MASLQIREVDPGLVARLKLVARRERRTLSQQVLYVLERHVERELGARPSLATMARRLEAFWSEQGGATTELEPPSRGDAGREERIARILAGETG